MANQLHLSIDRSSPVPLYHQVVQGIEAAIQTGLLEPGTGWRTRSISPPS